MPDRRFTVNIPGQPVAKGRPRFSQNGRTYTPAKTRIWEKSARILAGQKMFMEERRPFTEPLQLRVVATFEIPPSWPGWKREAAAKGVIQHTVTPDGDNLVKAAKDALNGVVYADDAQVVMHTGTKLYGLEAGVLITVDVFDGLPCQVKKRFELDQYLLNQQQQR